jgi:hypothetical protein
MRVRKQFRLLAASVAIGSGLAIAPTAQATTSAPLSGVATPTLHANRSVQSSEHATPLTPPAAKTRAIAASEEIDTAVAGAPDWSSEWGCDYVTGAEACFITYGDHIWVKDSAGDGLAASAYWENYLKNSSGDWVLYRYGRCENHLGAGKWGGCNKDFYEDGTSPNALGGKGSEICVWAEVTGDVSSSPACLFNVQ